MATELLEVAGRVRAALAAAPEPYELVSVAELARLRADAELGAAVADLVTLIRFGFLVRVGDRRAHSDDIHDPNLRVLLKSILGASDSAVALRALADTLANQEATE